MNKKTVRDVDFNGKHVLIRVDFNVPLDGDQVADDTRIRAAMPTINYILEQHPASLVLMSHLGRPKGERKPAYSLAPVVSRLAELLDRDVGFGEDCIGEPAKEAIANLEVGGMLLLENTRFHKGERDNDPAFAKQLAEHGEIFVNDAFGTAHRAHASNVGVAAYLPAVAGLLMEKEIDYLANAIRNPQHPFVAILGGAKVSDKIGVIESLLGKVDKLLIGGGMANTLFKAQGYNVGNSLVEEEVIDTGRNLLEKAGDKLILPVDVVIGDAFDNDARRSAVKIEDGVPPNWAIYDIGPETVDAYDEHLTGVKTIVWNGPVGVSEMPNFAKGTFAIARKLAEATQKGAISIIGGGDSASAVEKAGVADQVTHVSTGGGASLDMLEGKTLPGLAVLQDK